MILPFAIPEIPVENITLATDYYVHHLGFTLDWGGDQPEGIAGISRDRCRLFLTSRAIRQNRYQNNPPIVIWLNLDSIQQVNDLHDHWRTTHANILSPPESKPWKLHEFTATDLDRNFIRVFYDFSRDV